jgi:aspartyl/asparaginyl beta-hydroxylase (cupin superfamily)/Flp pilus assembly protein TadD
MAEPANYTQSRVPATICRGKLFRGEIVSSGAPAQLDEPTIVRALQASKAEAAAGRMGESDQLLAQLARQAPGHPAVLNELGVRMMNRGAADQAHALFLRATSADPKHPSLWANLATSLKALGRRAEEMDAIEKALEVEPRHLSALLQKGAYFEHMGDKRQAARTYANALACIPPGAEPPVAVREALDKAKALVASDRAALSAALEQSLAEARARHQGEPQRRVDKCLDILLGARKSFRSEPTWMYFPELPAIEFFERSDFGWLDALEQATDDIRSELLQALVTDQAGLTPYIDFPSSMPLDQWKDLNRSRRWSAYFLWNQGAPNADHVARCPKTARALEAIPARPRITARAPTAFFSILEPKTRIPPHTGVTNTRLTVHLPLIVPESCGFRVGSTTREWRGGDAWVFDDTIEHEAWNDSDAPRAILIFDIWNPLLSPAECELIQVATEAYVRYYAVSAAPLA